MAIHEECGVFGILSRKRERLGKLVYYGLYALQHRGQESCGIAVTDTYGKRKVHFRKGLGLVNEVFDEEELGKLKGNLGVGHVRYSKAGGTRAENAQPLVREKADFITKSNDDDGVLYVIDQFMRD